MNEESKFWDDLKSGRFASMIQESSKGKKIAGAGEVYNIMKPVFAQEDDVESFHCLFLDSKNRLIAIEKLFTGSIASSQVYPREIIKRAIALKAAAVIFVHNHPSGDPTPSSADASLTMKIGVLLKCMDLTLHDHIIIGEGYHSMADSGFMENIKRKFMEYGDAL